jgi:RimJ/RimL family protein N-acetyltransferase
LRRQRSAVNRYHGEERRVRKAVRNFVGADVILEPQTVEHASQLFAILDDPRLYDFLDEPPPASEEALRDRLAALQSRRSPDGSERWLNWIARSSDGTLVGYVQATVAANGEADIAFVIGRPYWGRGYGFAASAAMLQKLSSRYAVTRVRATVDPANARSLRLLSKLGFEQYLAGDDETDLHFARHL